MKNSWCLHCMHQIKEKQCVNNSYALGENNINNVDDNEKLNGTIFLSGQLLNSIDENEKAFATTNNLSRCSWLLIEEGLRNFALSYPIIL